MRLRSRQVSSWIWPTAILVLVAGFLLGRVELLVLAAPLVIAGLASPAWPNHQQVAPSVDLAKRQINLTIGPGVRLVRLRLASEGFRPTTVLLSPQSKPWTYALDWRRTGLTNPLVVDADGFDDLLVQQTPAGALISDTELVLPNWQPIGHPPLAIQPRGLTGPAPSRRAGDGFDFRDSHRLEIGESGRRIAWRSWARNGGDVPWVIGTQASGEPVAMLLIDSRDEVGPDLHTWSGLRPLRVDEPTSLDIARGVSASLAHALLAQSSRVGLIDLASGRRSLSPSTGRRHYQRLVQSLAITRPVGPATARLRPPQLPTDADVYLLSSLLDATTVDLITSLRQAGHRLVVIDCLPDIRPVPELNLEVAWRLLRAERGQRLHRLRQSGLTLVHWSDAGSEGLARALDLLGHVRPSIGRRP
ncbi:MAG: hypothetical protein LBV30_10460 [Propionibacteriaceae bacterium]|jgi:uncharacterized protein (DUF58 family)|nr:hypothetical protein [Propionibacteriaceae bacterium]